MSYIYNISIDDNYPSESCSGWKLLTSEGFMQARGIKAFL